MKVTILFALILSLITSKFLNGNIYDVTHQNHHTIKEESTNTEYSANFSTLNYLVEKFKMEQMNSINTNELLFGKLFNELFNEYCEVFSKNYVPLSEEFYFRKSNLFDSLIKLINHNKNKDKLYSIQLSKFSDQTIQELKGKYLNLDLSILKLKDVNFELLEKLDVKFKPIDWRDKDVFLPVRDQGECGSCWAFASVGALEALRYIKTGKKEYLSPQQLVSCDEKEKGCKGGWPSIAYSYISRVGGVVSEKQYPYEAQTSSCKNDKIKNPEVKIESRINRCDEEECLENNKQYGFLLNGPIAVVIDAYHSNFFNYKEGIYNESCSEPNHAIVLVGFGIENGNSYWIIRNSWGEKWGMNGYGYVKHDPKNNYSCNVNRYGYQPILK